MEPLERVPLNDVEGCDLSQQGKTRRKTLVRSDSADDLLLRFSNVTVKGDRTTSASPSTAGLMSTPSHHYTSPSSASILKATSCNSSPKGSRPIELYTVEDDLVDISYERRRASRRSEKDSATHATSTDVVKNPERTESSDEEYFLADSGVQPTHTHVKSAFQHITEQTYESSPDSLEFGDIDHSDTPQMGSSEFEVMLDQVKLDAFRQWVIGFCTVDFDLEIGQALECIFPFIDLTDAEKKTLAFSAFPDSNSSAHVGDTCFTFRMRSGPSILALYHGGGHSMGASPNGSPTLPRSKTPSEKPFLATEPVDTLSGPSARGVMPLDTDGYTYGYVFFRQQSDSQNRRGFFQKSLVILSPHPWKGLFSHMVRVMGTKLMDCLMKDRKASSLQNNEMGQFSRALLNRAYSEMASCGYSPVYFKLPFLNTCRTFCFPPNPRFPLLHESPKKGSSSRHTSMDSLENVSHFQPPRTKTPPSVFGVQTGYTLRQSDSSSSLHGYNALSARPLTCSLPPILSTTSRFYELFSRSLEMMWLCWELVVLGEPLLIMSDTPKSASDAIWGLVELIKPIPFGGDFRPYFTIQDSDFKNFTNRNRSIPAATLLGVTNPVFSKALEHWPHVIRVAKVPTKMSPSLLGSPTADKDKSSLQPTAMQNFMQTFGRTSPTPEARQSVGGVSNTSGMDLSVIQTVTTKYKHYLSKDKNMLKEIVEAAITGQKAHHLNNLIRRHFAELTDRFLQPLNRHFEGLIVGNPINMTLENLRSRPDIRPFKQDSFLKMIEQTPPALPVSLKRPAVDLYRNFFKSPNFASWLQHRTADLYREWRKRYISVLCDTDIEEWSRLKGGGGADVECVDLLLRIRDELNRYAPYFIVDNNRVYYSSMTLPAEIDPDCTRSPSRSPSPLRQHVDPGFVDATKSGDGRTVSVASESSSSSIPSSIENTQMNIESRQRTRTGSSNRYPPQLVVPVLDQSHAKSSQLASKSTSMGHTIPSAEQFQRLMEQCDIIMNKILPEDLRTSLKAHDASKWVW